MSAKHEKPEHDHSDDDVSDDDFDGYEPERETSFWGLNLAAGVEVEQDLDFGEEIEVTNAALSSGAKGDTVLSVSVNDQKFTLCTLNSNHPQYRLESHFVFGENPIKFSLTGPGSVSLTGVKQTVDFGDDMLGDDEEIPSDEEASLAQEGEDDDEEEKTPEKPKGKANGKPQKAQKEVKQEKGQQQPQVKKEKGEKQQGQQTPSGQKGQQTPSGEGKKNKNQNASPAANQNKQNAATPGKGNQQQNNNKRPITPGNEQANKKQKK